MLTLPDLKQKQILFIQSERGVLNRIKFQNDNIVFMKDGEIINRVSCHRVFIVFIVGDISITSELIKQGLYYGVSFFFLKNNFNLYASLNSSAEGNYLLRMRQYIIKNEEELIIAKNIVENKVKNQFRLLRSRNINHNLDEKDVLIKIKKSENHDSLRGIEGNVSRCFFKYYFDEINWRKRMPRVKPDIPNFLLDMGYTMMFNFIDAMLRLHGFDTYKGCYHKLFFQRKSLACDVIEPFRSIVDRELLKIYTLKRITESDFKLQKGKVSSSFEVSQKYSTIFLEAIMSNREDIYKYVQGFYRFVMNNENNKFPDFKIR